MSEAAKIVGLITASFLNWDKKSYVSHNVHEWKIAKCALSWNVRQLFFFRLPCRKNSLSKWKKCIFSPQLWFNSLCSSLVTKNGFLLLLSTQSFFPNHKTKETRFSLIDQKGFSLCLMPTLWSKTRCTSKIDKWPLKTVKKSAVESADFPRFSIFCIFYNLHLHWNRP